MKTTGTTPNQQNQQLVVELSNALFERELEVYTDGTCIVRFGSMCLRIEKFNSLLDKFRKLVMDGTKPLMEAHMATMMNDTLKRLQCLKMKNFELKQAA
jgi:hypothetical protein